jgi:hypothetical protein
MKKKNKDKEKPTQKEPRQQQNRQPQQLLSNQNSLEEGGAPAGEHGRHVSQYGHGKAPVPVQRIREAAPETGGHHRFHRLETLSPSL